MCFNGSPSFPIFLSPVLSFMAGFLLTNLFFSCSRCVPSLFLKKKKKWENLYDLHEYAIPPVWQLRKTLSQEKHVWGIFLNLLTVILVSQLRKLIRMTSRVQYLVLFCSISYSNRTYQTKNNINRLHERIQNNKTHCVALDELKKIQMTACIYVREER